MTYTPTRIFTKNVETEEREINPGLIQVQFDLIAQETKTLQDNIDKLIKSLENQTKQIDSPRFSRIFMHFGG